MGAIKEVYMELRLYIYIYIYIYKVIVILGGSYVGSSRVVVGSWL